MEKVSSLSAREFWCLLFLKASGESDLLGASCKSDLDLWPSLFVFMPGYTFFTAGVYLILIIKGHG